MTLRAMVLATSAILAWPQMALAQDSTTDEAEPQGSVIIVTAQRQSQSLQEVPIAVSAFDATALESQQIENAADLQLTLPNVSFSKGNFTGSSFTIRGIGTGFKTKRTTNSVHVSVVDIRIVEKVCGVTVAIQKESGYPNADRIADRDIDHPFGLDAVVIPILELSGRAERTEVRLGCHKVDNTRGSVAAEEGALRPP